MWFSDLVHMFQGDLHLIHLHQQIHPCFLGHVLSKSSNASISGFLHLLMQLLGT